MSKVQIQYVCCACVFALIFAVLTKPNQTPVVEYIEVKQTAIEEPEVLEEQEPLIDQEQLDCLAANIYHEARGESYNGKLAVAHVTMNRVKSSRFPNTVCDVVYQAKYSQWWLEQGKKVPLRNRCHFSWYCDGKSDEIVLTDKHGNIIKKNLFAWKQSNDIARKVLINQTQDPTHGATHYYNPDLAEPYWRSHYERVAVVDNHAFYR